MHAMVVRVKIDPQRGDDAVKMLHEVVVPDVKSRTGFQRGTWTRSADGSKGSSMVLFDTAENAQQLADSLAIPPEAPVTVESVDVYEVLAEA